MQQHSQETVCGSITCCGQPEAAEQDDEKGNGEQRRLALFQIGLGRHQCLKISRKIMQPDTRLPQQCADHISSEHKRDNHAIGQEQRRVDYVDPPMRQESAD